VDYFNFKYEEIYPLIRVYKNLLPDITYLAESTKKSEIQFNGKYIFSEWTDWFVFGKYCHRKEQLSGTVDSVDSNFDEEMNLLRRLSEATNGAITHYAITENIEVPQRAKITHPSLARYDTNATSGNNLAMQYHTDFNIGEWQWPGEKFLLTCTTYLNDDYQGGEIEFFINGDIFTYKPKAGDVLVFPSGSPIFPGNIPYFHAVKLITSGEKLLVRNYLKYEYPGSDEWHKNAEKHGLEAWWKICKEKDPHKNTLQITPSGIRMHDEAHKLYGISQSSKNDN